MTSTLGASPTHDNGSDGAMTQAKDAALDKTADVRRKIGSQVSDTLRTQTDERSTAAGEHVSSIARALETTSSQLEQSGEAAPAQMLDAVTEQVRHLGAYLTDSSGERLLHDIEDAARRRPWATAAVMFGVGLAASRLLGASSRSRYESRGGSAPVPRSTYASYPTQVGVGVERSSVTEASLRGGVSHATY